MSQVKITSKDITFNVDREDFRIDTIADLRELSSPVDRVWVSGYHTKDDGAFGSNIFRWNPTSVEDDNGGTIIKLDNVATGRYELQYDTLKNHFFGDLSMINGVGTTSENDNFIGAQGELTVDTTAKTVRVHDGSTNGGFPLAKGSDLTGIKYTTDQVLKNAINAKLVEEDLGIVFSVLGDSTEAGVGGGGSIYAEANGDIESGYANRFYYNLVKSDPAFIDIDRGVWPIAYNNDAEIDYRQDPESTSTLALAYPSWQITKGKNPTLEFLCNNARHTLTDKFTVYINQRTTDTACTFDLSIYDLDDNLIVTETIDTYIGAVTFNAVDYNVEGRMQKVTISHTTNFPRGVKIKIDNVVTVDRGSGVSVDGTAAIYGFTFGAGVEFHNLSVSSTTLLNNSSANQTRGVTTVERLTKAQSYNTNVFLIGWGTNDSKNGVSTPEEFKANYENLIGDIRAGQSNAIIILATDPAGAIGSVYENNIIFNEVVRDVAYANECLLFDVEKLVYHLPASFYADDVHPSVTGYYMLANSLSTFLGVKPANNSGLLYDDTITKAGEYIVPEGGVYTTETTVVEETIPYKLRNARFLRISAHLNFASNTALDQSKAKLYINNALMDEKIVSAPVVGTLAVATLTLDRIYEFAFADSYTIKLTLENTQVRIEGARSTVSYQWI